MSPRVKMTREQYNNNNNNIGPTPWGLILSHTFAHMRNYSLHFTHPITTRSSELLLGALGEQFGVKLLLKDTSIYLAWPGFVPQQPGLLVP